MAKREIISTDAGPRTGLPYSQAVRVGDLVFVAGQVAMDPATGQLVFGDIAVQTRQVLDNAQAILQAAGTSLEHAVETICFLRDMADFAIFNETYREYFSGDPPARTTVQAALPREGLRVEIRVVAAMPDGPAR
jgi:2-iminobutanoate/2-iminopropanoate deaminase